MKPFNTVGIVGAGAMGAGIAQVCLQAGLSVVLYDTLSDSLTRAVSSIEAGLKKGVDKQKIPAAVLESLSTTLKTSSNLYELGEDRDVIIEAAPEDLALKQDIFRELDKLCPNETILVSNTSSLSITALGGTTQRPGQVAGLHFFNPVPLMPLVEVIQGKQTHCSVIERLTAFAQQLGKMPVVCKDTPGFIVNRVARAYYGEALRLLDEQVADVETIDAILHEVGGFPMGPFQLMDLIGIDVNYAVSQSVYNAFFQEARFKPHPIQRQMVEAGLLGKKTGQGFYAYAR